MKRLQIWIQYVLPQHFLSTLMGRFAESQVVWFKNWMISYFLKRYAVDMQLALITDPYAYPSFNAFFIRAYKPECRPIDQNAKAIVSPVDGVLLERGMMTQQKLVQAKGFDYDLNALLGGDGTYTQRFTDGSYASFYLAPHNYHRVHMPFSGQLIKTLFIPGDLFSVNKLAAQSIPSLYTRNERLVAIFETEQGLMAVIFIGAMIVGSIQTVWVDRPYKSKARKIISNSHFPAPIHLTKGAELGHFKMGSSVIILFEKNNVVWTKPHDSTILFGEKIGQLNT